MINLKVTAGRTAFLDLLRAADTLEIAIKAGVRAVAAEARSAAAAAIAGPKSGREYGRARKRLAGGLKFIQARRASAPGEPPGIATGHLYAALRTKVPRRNPYAAVVFVHRRAAPHRHLLEFGTKRMAARPLIAPLEARYLPLLEQAVERAVDEAARRVG